ncbi:MAG: hypothetical protein ACI9WU_000243, partial [Myxococcota bacterium]
MSGLAKHFLVVGLAALVVLGCPSTDDDPAQEGSAQDNFVDGGGDGVPTVAVDEPYEPCVGDWDCDGIPASDDCNDFSAGSTTKAQDADCDTFVTADDCNDNDPLSSNKRNDADCDGTPVLLDCDDTDPSSTVRADDNDCDGHVEADDCNDN